MDDQLDNDLRNHIREVFDNYEDASADEGWLLLREKFPAAEQERRAFAWVWWSAAAIVLAFLGTALWMMSRNDKPQNTVAKTPTHQQQEQKITGPKVQDDSVVKANPGIQPRQLAAQNQAGNSHQSTQNYQTGINRPVQTNATPAQNTPAKPVAVNTDTVNYNIAAVQKPKRADSINTAIAKTTAPQIAANNELKATDQTAATSQSVTIVPKPKKTIMDMFNEDKGAPMSKKKSRDEESVKTKNVNFGLYAATYFNYAKGSDNQVNMGAGVTSDIKISRNLKLVTGLSVAQNSLSYQGVPSETALAKSNLLPAAAPNTKGTYDFTALSTPTVKNYNASLIGLDIPLNLKYEINPKKTDAYILMGVSSGTFIDESYTYKYNYPSLLSSNLQQTRDETTGNNFSGFYFAKTLNLAVGMGYPLGKNRLVIEPFLKYPLDGLGSQNLKFGAGGVNLKFNFLPSQKK